MIDTVNLVFQKHPGDIVAERLRGSEVAPERLFDSYSRPIRRLIGQPGLAYPIDNRTDQRRRRGTVIKPVTQHAAVQRLNTHSQTGITVWIF